MKAIFNISMLASVAILFSGCYAMRTVYVEPAPAPAPTIEVVYVQTIPVAQPAVIVVNRPPQPARSYVWIEGYWTWDYSYDQYVWVQGYWVRPPYAESVWIPGYWEFYAGRGYVWINAAWAPQGYQVNYGRCPNRYDYYGRQVYYGRPSGNSPQSRVYVYDNRQEYINRNYTSSPAENNTRGRNYADPNVSPSRQGTTNMRNEQVNGAVSPSRSNGAAPVNNDGQFRTIDTNNERSLETATPSRGTDATTTPSRNGAPGTESGRQQTEAAAPTRNTEAATPTRNTAPAAEPSRETSATTTRQPSSTRSGATTAAPASSTRSSSGTAAPASTTRSSSSSSGSASQSRSSSTTSSSRSR